MLLGEIPSLSPRLLLPDSMQGGNEFVFDSTPNKLDIQTGEVGGCPFAGRNRSSTLQGPVPLPPLQQHPREEGMVQNHGGISLGRSQFVGLGLHDNRVYLQQMRTFIQYSRHKIYQGMFRVSQQWIRLQGDEFCREGIQCVQMGGAFRRLDSLHDMICEILSSRVHGQDTPQNRSFLWLLGATTGEGPFLSGLDRLLLFPTGWRFPRVRNSHQQLLLVLFKHRKLNSSYKLILCSRKKSIFGFRFQSIEAFFQSCRPEGWRPFSEFKIWVFQFLIFSSSHLLFDLHFDCHCSMSSSGSSVARSKEEEIKRFFTHPYSHLRDANEEPNNEASKVVIVGPKSRDRQSLFSTVLKALATAPKAKSIVLSKIRTYLSFPKPGTESRTFPGITCIKFGRFTFLENSQHWNAFVNLFPNLQTLILPFGFVPLFNSESRFPSGIHVVIPMIPLAKLTEFLECVRKTSVSLANQGVKIFLKSVCASSVEISEANEFSVEEHKSYYREILEKRPDSDPGVVRSVVQEIGFKCQIIRSTSTTTPKLRFGLPLRLGDIVAFMDAWCPGIPVTILGQVEINESDFNQETWCKIRSFSLNTRFVDLLPLDLIRTFMKFLSTLEPGNPTALRLIFSSRYPKHLITEKQLVSLLTVFLTITIFGLDRETVLPSTHFDHHKTSPDTLRLDSVSYATLTGDHLNLRTKRLIESWEKAGKVVIVEDRRPRAHHDSYSSDEYNSGDESDDSVSENED